jgi:hypothetical protein
MTGDQAMETMLAQIIDTQKTLVADVNDMKRSLIEIVKLEAQQVSQKEVLTRMGGHIDKIEADVKENYREVHGRINNLESAITEMRIVSARVVVKVTAIATGTTMVVGSIIAFTLSKMLD